MRTPTQSLCAEIRARVERHANAAHTESRTDIARLLEIVELYQAALERIASWETNHAIRHIAQDTCQAADKVASRE